MSERWESAVDALLEIRSQCRSRPDFVWSLFKHLGTEARALTDDLIRAVDSSEPIYVSGDVADVYEIAGQSFERENVRREDALTPVGLAVFPRLLCFKNQVAIAYEQDDTIVVKPPGEGESAFSALLWRCNPKTLNVWMLARSQEWSPVGENTHPRHHPADQFFLVTGVGERKWDNPENESGLEPLHAFWKLAAALVTTKQTLSRGCMRRMARASVEQRGVTVIRLRRARYPREGDAQQIDWSCRWLVRGHWRTLADGRQTFIPPYVKGPDDKPFRVTDRVFEFIR